MGAQSDYSKGLALETTVGTLGLLSCDDAGELVFTDPTGGKHVVTPNPTSSGAQGAQLGTTHPLQIFGHTHNAAAQVLASAYLPPAGHAAALDGTLILTDRTAQTASKQQIVVALRNYGGLVVAGASITGAHGDASLGTATLAVTVVGGVLTFTLTPPAAYAGDIDWYASLTATEN